MPYLKFLSDDEVKAMHEATMKVMREVGIIWTHQPSLDVLLQAGCTMNGNRVCIPENLIMDSVAKANKRPEIRGRNGTSIKLEAANYFSIILAAQEMYLMQEQEHITLQHKKIA